MKMHRKKSQSLVRIIQVNLIISLLSFQKTLSKNFNIEILWIQKTANSHTTDLSKSCN